jgi:hypothetical protein
VWSDTQRGALESLGTVDVSDNNITVQTGMGIEVYDATSTTATVTGNTIEGADTCIAMDSVSTSNLTGNTLNGCGTAISFAQSEATAPVSATVSGNFFNSPAPAIGLENATSLLVDASGNWWDRTNGPTASDNVNSDTGANVSANVTYRPWCLTDDCASVDATAPTVLSVVANPNPAKAGDVTMTITFSEPMNTGIDPTVEITGLTGGTLAVTGSFTNDTTWEGTVTVPDNDEETTATVSISGGEDPSGNQMATDTANTLDVDTIDPVISSITSVANAAVDTTAGWLKPGDTITFTLTPSKQETNATIDATYNDVPLTWTPGAGYTYVATYTVNEGDDDQTTPLQLTGVTLTDAAGNTSASFDGSYVTDTIDANSPTISTTVSNQYFSPGSVDGVKDTTDIDTGFSESAAYTIEVQDASHTTVKSWSGTAMDPNARTWDGTDTLGAQVPEGTYTVVVTATDDAGNQTVDNSQTIVVDNTEPTLTLISPVNATTTGQAPSLSFTATDTVTATPTTACTLDSASTNCAVSQFSGLSDGSHTLVITASDDAGNATSTSSTFTVDTTDSSLAFTQTTSTSLTVNDTSATTTLGVGASTVSLPPGTVVTRTDGAAIFPSDISSKILATTDVDVSSTDGSTIGAIQWGVAGAELSFTPAITVTLHVGSAYNGRTFAIYRSESSTSGWTQTGLVDATCTVVSGDCTFMTNNASYFAVVSPNSGSSSTSSGGGGGGGGAPITGTNVSTPSNGGTVGGGEVLGAAAYNFTQNLTVGAEGQDVTELQKILIAEGDLAISAPTGYFGPLTKAAVVKYQTAHHISPTSGYVGPLTRAELNKGVIATTPEGGSVLGASTQKLSDAQIQAILNLLSAFNADASVIANVEHTLKGQ